MTKYKYATETLKKRNARCREIRRCYYKLGATVWQLAARFNIAEKTIQDIIFKRGFYA